MTKNQLEELTIRINQINELKDILEAVIPEESYSFNSEGQKMISILTADERLLIKEKMFNLIEKYFI